MNCECLFVCGGYNNNQMLKTCELYNFRSSMIKPHQLPGVCYFGKSQYWSLNNMHCINNNTNNSSSNILSKNDTVIVIGGYPNPRFVEEYSL